MKIDGKALAQTILENIKIQVSEMKQININPHLVVILIGDDANSLSFIKQKQKAANQIGIKFTLHHLDTHTPMTTVTSLLRKVSNDPLVHAIVIQRPVPKPFDAEELIQLVDPKKDVDGFHPNSPHLAPVVHAIWKILINVYQSQKNELLESDFDLKLISWLSSQKIVILGRGETAGRPIANSFLKNNIQFTHLHSQSANPQQFIDQADIIISCVGKPGLIRPENLKPGVVLISVGMKNVVGKLKGDYIENEVQSIASFYTPTPGGVGPVNVACLMQNVVAAAT